MRTIAMVLFALGVVACQPQSGDDRSASATPAVQGSAEPLGPVPQPDIAPPGATFPPRENKAPQPVLSAMTYDEFSARIPSGTGCSFTPEGPDKPTLMIATAPIENDARAQAVIKLDGTVRILRSKAAGGYDRLREGAVLTNDQGVSVTVVRAKGEGQPEGIESTVWPATMTVRAAPDRERIYKGSYGCGA